MMNPIKIMPRVLTQTFGVAGAIIESGGKILLVRENQPGRQDHGKWSHPAGWIEVGEDPLETVKKEVREEAGLEFTPTHLLGIYSLLRKDIESEKGIPHAIKLTFAGTFHPDKRHALQGDTLEVKWFSPEEIYRMGKSTLRDMDIKQMVKDYFSRKRYPLAMIKHMVQE